MEELDSHYLTRDIWPDIYKWIQDNLKFHEGTVPLLDKDTTLMTEDEKMSLVSDFAIYLFEDIFDLELEY